MQKKITLREACRSKSTEKQNWTR